MLRIRSRITGISIHALLAESDLSNTVLFESPICISIHALLAESDASRAVTTSAARYFYPRSPCGERQLAARDESIMFVFLSTLSLRRATDTVSARDRPKEFLSTLSLRRATISKVKKGQAKQISIHALLAESDSTALA